MTTETVTVRAPGRVNLIGEHTDYSQLPVLPIAIDRWLTVTATANDSNALTAASALFPEAGRFERGEHRAQEGWLRYVAGVLREMEDVAPGRGAEVRVTGDLPASGGLSSSSALTVGLIAACNEAWGAGLDREEVVRRATLAERHVGVETGGMDQQVIAFGESAHALRLDFRPAARRQVRIPDGLAFVVAYSGEEAPKGGAARDAYNERVVGARLAAVLLADQVGVDLDTPYTLGQVADIDVVDVLVDDLPEKVDAHTVAHGVDVDIARIVQLSHTTLDTRAMLPVRRVARHILGEAQRVDAAQAALEAGDLTAFGKLLNESHESLRQDMRCSTPALDRVCAAMRKAGALGARLTGAGFGGYALATCAPGDVNSVIEAATAATGGPAFEVRASQGYQLLSVTKAVLLAAGRGTRLGAITANYPKPLLDVGGRPLIAHILDGLLAARIDDVTIVTGHFAALLESELGNGEHADIAIGYVRQESIEGTARALALARDFCGDEQFFFGWGDILVRPENYARVVRAARFADHVLAANRTDDPASGAAVYVDDASALERGEGAHVTRLVEKPPIGTSTTNWNNAGFGVLGPAIWPEIERLRPSQRGEYELPQAIGALVEGGAEVRAVPVIGPWFDVGTPDDLDRARAEFGRR